MNESLLWNQVRAFAARFLELTVHFIGPALAETVYMTLFSAALALVFGFLITIVLIMTGPQGLRPRPKIYAVFDFSVNLLRSFPFIILMILVLPLSKLLFNIRIGTNAVIMPLTIGAAPFVARIMEGSLLEVNREVVEAARSFGAGDMQIIFRVMFTEALPGIVLNIAVLIITLLGYSAMAGTVGGGGLGNLAIVYGYHRFQEDMMIYAVIVLIVIVQCVQMLGNCCYRKLR